MRIFSGIQPTGRKHLGNYIGAIAQYVSSQERGEGIFCIVDLHALTVAYDPAELRERLYDTLAILIAAGLDPARSILFRQSDVHEHTELTWLLSSVTELGRLDRMHQFRDKSAARELVSAGLLFYPVLMAADVLAYRAHEVPVGEDQREHVELMRDVARRFNAPLRRRRGDPGRARADASRRSARASWTCRSRRARCPRPAAPSRARCWCSTSRRRSRRRSRAPSPTPAADVRRGPDKAGIGNLIEILAAVRGTTPDAIEAEFADSRYGDFKGAVAAAVIEYLAPVRERYGDLRGDEAELERILAAGAERAREIAGPVVADVRERMGVGTPGGG